MCVDSGSDVQRCASECGSEWIVGPKVLVLLLAPCKSFFILRLSLSLARLTSYPVLCYCVIPEVILGFGVRFKV